MSTRSRYVLVETGTGMGESYLDRYRGYVRGYSERGDAAIVADVRAALGAANELDARSIDVSASHSDVVLSGSVPSLAMRSLAVELARRVAGVAIVHDELTLRPSDA